MQLATMGHDTFYSRVKPGQEVQDRRGQAQAGQEEQHILLGQAREGLAKVERDHERRSNRSQRMCPCDTAESI
eukprot:800208-Pyramimonas_sp.AAC.1